MDELRCTAVNEPNLSILGLCETFLNPAVPDVAISMENFSLERLDRSTGLGGGIVIYISHKLSYKRRYDLEKVDVEAIWIELTFSNSKSILICSA